MQSYLNNLLKDVAEGKYGASAQKAYWWTSKHGLLVGLGLSIADLVLVTLSVKYQWMASADIWLRLAAGCLAGSGLATGFHAAEPPKKG